MRAFHVRRRAIWVAAFAATITACSDDPTGPATTGAVTVTDFEFQPEAIEVAAGATVTWTWSGASEEHDVTFADPSITDSALQLTGTHTATMPTTPGTYAYVCTQHLGMDGTIQVVS